MQVIISLVEGRFLLGKARENREGAQRTKGLPVICWGWVLGDL